MSELIRNSGIYQRLTSSTEELERLFKEVDEKKTPPDIKKVLLLMGLGTLSWISTYSGLLELIQANSGDIPLTYKLAIGFAVAMLMLMIVYILDQLFAPLNWLLRTIYVFGYIFLTIISVGFGFGFYWKYLESRSEATRSAESAVTQVQNALQGGQSRLEQLEATLTTLTALSLQKATEEREKGNSCPNSRPGDGPRRRLRDSDAKNFSFAGDFVTKRAQSVAEDIRGLNGDLAKIASRAPSTVDPATGTRNAFMKSLNQRLDMTITRFNAFRTDPQLASIRNNLAERSNTTIFPDDRGGTFKCPDNQLQSALRGVVQAIDQLPTLQKPKINASEGSEATIEAFRRLGATLSGMLVLKMPPSEDELREMRKKAVRSLDKKQAPSAELNATQPGLNERDYIPLAIAVFVDFCLLLVSINRPMDRLKSLVPVMKDARDGPISGILSSFHATHFTGIREEFSLFQHVVFDWGGHYYVAVPLASNDIQAQYLANLFVSLEGRGIVDRAMIPPAFIIRGKLKKMGSSFAEHRAFRLYKFRNGAWSNIVLDAVMGAAKDVAEATRAEAARRQLAADKAETSEARNANFDSLFDDTKSDEKILDADLNAKNINGAQRETRIAHKTSVFDEPLPVEDDMTLPRLLRGATSLRNSPFAQTAEQRATNHRAPAPQPPHVKREAAASPAPADHLNGKKRPAPTRRFHHPAPYQQTAPKRSPSTPAAQNGAIVHPASLNGYANGHSNNHANAHANGHANGHLNAGLNGAMNGQGQRPINGLASRLAALEETAAPENPAPDSPAPEQGAKAPTPFTNPEELGFKQGNGKGAAIHDLTEKQDDLTGPETPQEQKPEPEQVREQPLKEPKETAQPPLQQQLAENKEAANNIAAPETQPETQPLAPKTQTPPPLPLSELPTRQKAPALQDQDEAPTASDAAEKAAPAKQDGEQPKESQAKAEDHIHVRKITNWYANKDYEDN